MPEPSLPAMQWAQILTTAARRRATTPTVRIVPVASCQNAAVIHDQQRCIVSTQFLQNRHVNDPKNSNTHRDDSRRRHHNLASAIATALQRPAAWAQIPTNVNSPYADTGDQL